MNLWSWPQMMEANRMPEKILLNEHEENDGSLIVVESEKDIPFLVKRTFWIYNTPENAVRAEHACRNSDFLFVCLSGRVKITLDNGRTERSYVLDRPSQGILVPRMTWMKTEKFSEDAILLVLASEKYDPMQYCSDYKIFLKEIDKI